jgi:hypothetical protein
VGEEEIEDGGEEDRLLSKTWPNEAMKGNESTSWSGETPSNLTMYLGWFGAVTVTAEVEIVVVEVAAVEVPCASHSSVRSDPDLSPLLPSLCLLSRSDPRGR